MSIPTKGEEFAKLIEYLTKAQESAAMIAHLERDSDKLHAQGWLGVSEMLRLTKLKVTQFATKGLQ